MNLTKEEIITCESYKKLCDYVYYPDQIQGTFPPAGIVHVNMEEIPAFFEAIKDSPHKYVVVSSCSDFGIVYQEHAPVWYDMGKWIKMMVNPQLGYNQLRADPRCDVKRCNIADKYSAKCYSYTAFTFPAIPDNIVHWFMTNSRILPQEESRITVIPFGVAPNGADDIMEIRKETEGYEKEARIYVNWVDYTLERLEIKQFFQLIQDHNITIVSEAKPYKSYLRDLARHSIIVSPEGNGIDCYRTLEALYMESMPVVGLNPTTIALSDLPIALTRTFYGINSQQFHNVYLMMKNQNRPTDKIRLPYWKGQFESKRSLL